MAWAETTRNLRSTHPIPAPIDPQTLISALHDHDRIIHLNPLVTDSTRITLTDDSFLATETTDPTNATAFRISDKIPWYGTISYTAAITKTAEGTDSIVNAPMGLKVWTKMRVRKADGEDGGAQWLLEEGTVFRGNWLLMSFTVANYESSHNEMREKLFKQLMDEDGNGK